jgi:hypothetical protein
MNGGAVFRLRSRKRTRPFETSRFQLKIAAAFLNKNQREFCSGSIADNSPCRHQPLPGTLANRVALRLGSRTAHVRGAPAYVEAGGHALA